MRFKVHIENRVIMQNNFLSYAREDSKQVWRMQKSLYAALIITFTGILILSAISAEFVLLFVIACAAGTFGFALAMRTMGADSADLENIDFALQRIASRRPRMAPLAGTFVVLEAHYEALNEVFFEFYPEVLNACLRETKKRPI